MPKLTLLYTISVDGWIADPNGRTPFSEASWERYRTLAGACGHLIMGRTTYELFRVDRSIAPMPIKTIDVLSRTARAADEGVSFYRSVEELQTSLASRGGEQMLVLGGARTASALTAAGMISQIILLIDSVILGGGIPLFDRALSSARVSRRSVDAHHPDFTEVRYELRAREGV